MRALRSAMTPVRWGKAYLALWALWAGFVVYAGIFGTPGLRPIWWWLVGSFLALEAWGAASKIDGMPMLTHVFGRYVPAEVLFPVLALGMWRLSNWVPGWVLFPLAAWQLIHFVQEYHRYQKHVSGVDSYRITYTRANGPGEGG